MQRSIAKHGIERFSLVIYYWHKDPAILLADIETKVISSFPFEYLFNFKRLANSLLGYKHSQRAKLKMKYRLSIKKKITLCMGKLIQKKVKTHK